MHTWCTLGDGIEYPLKYIVLISNIIEILKWIPVYEDREPSLEWINSKISWHFHIYVHLISSYELWTHLPIVYIDLKLKWFNKENKHWSCSHFRINTEVSWPLSMKNGKVQSLYPVGWIQSFRHLFPSRRLLYSDWFDPASTRLLVSRLFSPVMHWKQGPIP